MKNDELLSDEKIKTDLENYISNKNLDLYEAIHEALVPNVYRKLDSRLQRLYKKDSLAQFIKNRNDRYRSTANKKDPLKKSVARITQTQLLVWELLKAVGKSYDDIFSDWYNASEPIKESEVELSSEKYEEKQLSIIESKIDYIAEKIAVTDKFSLQEKYVLLKSFTLSMSNLIKDTKVDMDKEIDEKNLNRYFLAIYQFILNMNPRNKIYTTFQGLLSKHNDFSRRTLAVFYQLFLIIFFFHSITNYEDSYVKKFSEKFELYESKRMGNAIYVSYPYCVFEFEDDATVESNFIAELKDDMDKILFFIKQVGKMDKKLSEKTCKSLFEVFQKLFENPEDIFFDKDGNLPGLKLFRTRLLFAARLKLPLPKTQIYLKLFISKEKIAQTHELMKWYDDAIREIF